MQKSQQNKRIVVENISKTFQIGFKKNQIALERAISLFSGKEPKGLPQNKMPNILNKSK